MIVVAGSGTLTRHVEDCDKPLKQYRRTLTVDVSEWGVKPTSVTVPYFDPMYLWVRTLPLPPEREEGEPVASWITRCGECPLSTQWQYTPMQNGAGDRVIDGTAACGDSWGDAMRSTPDRSLPAVIDLSMDGVSLNNHAAVKSVCPIKARHCVVCMSRVLLLRNSMSMSGGWLGARVLFRFQRSISMSDCG